MSTVLFETYDTTMKFSIYGKVLLENLQVNNFIQYRYLF